MRNGHSCDPFGILPQSTCTACRSRAGKTFVWTSIIVTFLLQLDLWQRKAVGLEEQLLHPLVLPSSRLWVQSWLHQAIEHHHGRSLQIHLLRRFWCHRWPAALNKLLKYLLRYYIYTKLERHCFQLQQGLWCIPADGLSTIMRTTVRTASLPVFYVSFPWAQQWWYSSR